MHTDIFIDMYVYVYTDGYVYMMHMYVCMYYVHTQVPFTTLFALLCMWLLISAPLVVAGTCLVGIYVYVYKYICIYLHTHTQTYV